MPPTLLHLKVSRPRSTDCALPYTCMRHAGQGPGAQGAALQWHADCQPCSAEEELTSRKDPPLPVLHPAQHLIAWAWCPARGLWPPDMLSKAGRVINYVCVNTFDSSLTGVLVFQASF